MGESTQEDLSNRQCIHTPPSTSDLLPSQSSLPPPFRWPSNLLFLTKLILPMKARIRSRVHFRPILTKSPKDQMHTRPLPSQSLRLPLRLYRSRTTSTRQRAPPPFPRNSAISSTGSLQPSTSSPKLTLASKNRGWTRFPRHPPTSDHHRRECANRRLAHLRQQHPWCLC